MVSFMPIRKSLVTILLIWMHLTAFNQDTAVYEVKTKMFSLGNMQAIHYQEAFIDTYILESKVRLWSVYNVHYYLESKYKNEVLISSLAQIKANDKIKHYCQVNQQAGFYVRKTLTETDTLLNKNIYSGVTKLYFKTPQEPDSVFSELEGVFVPFTKENDRSYVLGKANDSQEFTFNQQRVKKITAPNPILDFFIVLKK